MKAAILVEDQYQVLEVWYPYLRLREEGIETILVGTGRKKEYLSKEGYPAPEELSIKNPNATPRLTKIVVNMGVKDVSRIFTLVFLSGVVIFLFIVKPLILLSASESKIKPIFSRAVLN